MSLLGIMGSGHLYRLGCTGALNAAKILSANPGQTSTATLPSYANGSGHVFTAKYLHTLQQNKKNNNLGNITSSVEISKSIINAKNRAMSSTGDHVKLWSAERIVSASLIPIIPLALITPCAPLDYLLAFGLTVHSHWGIEAIVHDYVRPSIFGETIPKISIALVYGLSAMTLGGLFYFIYSDVGIGQGVRMLWKL